MRFLSLCLLLLLATPLATASQAPANDAAPQDKQIEALTSTLPLIVQEEANLVELRTLLDNTNSEVERQQVEIRISAARARLEELRDNFRTLAAGVDESLYFGRPESTTNLNDEIQEILRPILGELREATAAPRELEELRDSLAKAQQQRQVALIALERINQLLGREVLGEEIAAKVRTTRELWQERLDEANGRIAVIDAKLTERERTTPTLFTAVSTGLSSFWKSRGLNVLLAIAAFILTLLTSRRLYRLLQRASPLHRRGETRLTARLADLLAAILGFVAATAAVLVVFYLRGDWLLLTLSAIAIGAILIASRNSLPPYLDQIRTILNLGPVREGERLVHDGVPWRVDRLGFYCHFSNPLLGGGRLRLPIRTVNELSSRPCDHKEPWFPTKENDWVILGDGTHGKIIQQTPERVTVLRLGGSRKTYPTADFLSLSPENLSTGFRVTTTFGIDYAHQPICTGEIPRILTHCLERELIAHFGQETLHSLKVEFQSAGSSSLDYAVLADFAGTAAFRYKAIKRLIQKLCVEACNEHHWVIPFTQLTLHQATPPPSGHPPHAPPGTKPGAS